MKRSTWIAAAVLAAAACSAVSAEEAFRPLQVGEKVPAYTVRSLSTDSIRLGPGQPVTLVNLWATWCVPCRQEFPELENIARSYAKRGLRVVAVSIEQGNSDKVRRFIKSQGVTFPIGHDPSGEIQRVLRSAGVPETFLVGPDGKLLWRKAGALRAGAADARAAIDAALVKH